MPLLLCCPASSAPTATDLLLLSTGQIWRLGELEVDLATALTTGLFVGLVMVTAALYWSLTSKGQGNLQGAQLPTYYNGAV